MVRALRSFLALALVLLAACGGGSGDAPVTVTQLGDDAVPGEIAGLRVDAEEVGERLAETEKPYVDAVGLYSLRDGRRLEATLQVSRFTDDVDPEDETFRQSIVAQIGSTEAKPFRMADEIVYLTASKRQNVAVFFEDRSFVVLSTLESFERSRALLREVMELDL
jgi:hypothetical protein